MWNPDWRNPEEYRFCKGLNAGQWAWEFLRRNPDYEDDWIWFQSTWEKLEGRYGKPPQRDFQAWQRDPDAHRKVDEATGDCRVDEDSVLIECWMGAKWGFYKFPLDPQTDCPVIGEDLSWRPLDDERSFVDVSDRDFLGDRIGKVALGFDLELPLRPQLESAKLVLKRRQAHLRQKGQLQLRTVAGLYERWTLMLRVLDASRRGEPEATVVSVLAAEVSRLEMVELQQEAEILRAGAYRQLAFLPQGKVR